jgi:predicted double-glycine peptidase
MVAKEVLVDGGKKGGRGGVHYGSCRRSACVVHQNMDFSAGNEALGNLLHLLRICKIGDQIFVIAGAHRREGSESLGQALTIARHEDATGTEGSQQLSRGQPNALC